MLSYSCICVIGVQGYKGIEVDAFYRLQSLIWGTGSDAGTIAGKVFVDQFVYNVIYAAASIVAAYQYKDTNFNCPAWKLRIRTRTFWLWKVPETIMSGWLVWIPATAMIYSLPSDLQMPLMNIMLIYWSLILTLLATK